MILLSTIFKDKMKFDEIIEKAYEYKVDGIEIRIEKDLKYIPDFSKLNKLKTKKILTLKREASNLVNERKVMFQFFDFVDLDLQYYLKNSGLTNLPSNKLIISTHVGKIEDLKIEDIKKLPKESLRKIVLTKAPLKEFFELKKYFKDEATFFISGEKKKITRIYGIKTNQLNYSYINTKTAPGQFDVDTANRIKNSDLYGLVGTNLGKSLSSFIYNRIFEKYEIKAIYLNFEIYKNSLREFIQMAKDLGFKGLNFTFPFKTESSIILRGKEEPINFVKFNGITEVKNTDLEALKNLTKYVDHKKILIYGNGSSAVTTVNTFKDSEIYVIGRNKERVRKFCRTYGARVLTKPMKFDLLVNATPVGMYGHANVPSLIRNSKFITILDFPYSSSRTEFEKLASTLKSNYISGKNILAYQASLNLKYWLGLDVVFSEIMGVINAGFYKH